MFKTLAKGYGLGIVAGLSCGALFDLTSWQIVAVVWLGGAPMSLLLRPLTLPRLPRLFRLMSSRSTRTQSAGY